MALTHRDLWIKSKTFITRALAKRDEGAFDEFQLWAAITLEVLAKSSLAEIHPVLVVNPEKFDYLLVAVGHSNSTDYKTIMATTLFERCRKIVTNFDKVAEDFCVELANRRNGDLHSGEVPFESVSIDAWQSRYWHVTKLLVEFQQKTLEDYIGQTEAAAANAIIADGSLALSNAVAGRIRKHAEIFTNAHPAHTRDQIQTHAKITVTARARSRQMICACPACQCPGLLTGEFIDQEDGDELEDDPMYMEVTKYYESEAFDCVVCGLKLIGNEELEAAGLDTQFTKKDIKEIDYGPEYGND
jgi:hypothetical protein